MKVMQAKYAILTKKYDIRDAPIAIERAGRTCYKSEIGKVLSIHSAERFVRKLRDLGHGAMLEHGPNISVKFWVDRGITHEMVRHRVASFAQESTRYCNYSNGKHGNELTFICPPWVDLGAVNAYIEDEDPVYFVDIGDKLWTYAMQEAEDNYLDLIKQGWKPQQARSVLPNSLKAEIIITANIREWRHIFELRTAKAAHPQIREVMTPLLKELTSIVPCLFEDIKGYDWSE